MNEEIGMGLMFAGVLCGFAGMFTGSVIISAIALMIIAVPWIAYRIPPVGWIEQQLQVKL